MMALTRKRHRGLHLWLLAAALLAVALAGLALRSQHAGAIAEGTVAFTVTQSPAAPATVQVGSDITFTVNPTTAATTGLLVEFDYPQAALTFQGYSSSPVGVVCFDNTPAAGVVRCDYATTPPY